jgi:HlyD family secretion protein
VQNVVTYTVVLDVANPDMKLRPGMTANVSIVTESKKNVIKVPASAVRFSPPDFAKQNEPTTASASPFMPTVRRARPAGGQGQGRLGPTSYIWTVKNGQLGERIEVRQGITESGFVEITFASPDIKEGEEVAVSWTKQAGK